MAIELNFEDIKGLAAKASETAGAAGIKSLSTLGGGVNSGQDLISGINNILDKINTVMTNAKETIGFFRGIMPGIGGPGIAGPGIAGPGPGANKPYQPAPSLAQQLHRILNVAYSAYGDISIAELLQTVLNQYGNTKLSAILKGLERF